MAASSGQVDVVKSALQRGESVDVKTNVIKQLLKVFCFLVLPFVQIFN